MFRVREVVLTGVECTGGEDMTVAPTGAGGAVLAQASTTAEASEVVVPLAASVPAEDVTGVSVLIEG